MKMGLNNSDQTLAVSRQINNWWCVWRAGATLGIDNISLMQGCVNSGSVMDPPPLTDDGYCGLKVVAKGEKKGVRVEQNKEEGLQRGHRFGS